MLVHQHIFGPDEEVPIKRGKVHPQHVDLFYTVLNPRIDSKIQNALSISIKRLPDKRWRMEYYCDASLGLDWENHVYLSEMHYGKHNNFCASDLAFSAKLYGQPCKITAAECQKAIAIHTRCCACGHDFVVGEDILKLSLEKTYGFKFKNNAYFPIHAVNVSIHKDPHKQCKAGIGILNHFKDKHFAPHNTK